MIHSPETFDHSLWRSNVPKTSAAALSALLALSIAAMPLAARAQANSAACKPVLDANIKNISTPHHLYTTETTVPASAYHVSGEVISTGTASYVLYKGKWVGGTMSAKDNIAQMQENLKNTKVYQCRRLPDASIDGAAAIVYSAHSESEDAKTDAQFWVAKSSGLIVREEVDMYDDEAGPKRHISERFAYTNVQPPPGVK
jgi:hypothetical protein